ncbi:unnamed protein product [Penicillium nalgiovense]|uniref:Uncharacterized protein n=1 Tax=Penicillium nalgiovense TaxID=60175 RepID=A0A9W4HC36_PENNA|nr:unnamed protein product [Penicillium nalgiovense]CAG7987364.1 unnamed protein product [Penicillium nalgiovense]CAG7990400.1 unnamed protein product [Penicillium nalgiovense]CAG8027978.1 unnamed protein product [Penicillium nalgiovense]CAG8032605.1 unnamed protein product [Penicillium nalgiovense]
MDQKPFAVFPISLLKTIYLIGSLSWLQLLYAASYLARPFWNTHREYSPFKKAIDRTETSIINAILGTAPLSAYSSATSTERQWYLSAGNGTLNYENNIRTTSQPISNLLTSSPWPEEGHQDSDSSSGHETPTPRPGTEHTRENSPIYETVRKLRSNTRGSISKIANSARSIFRQPLTVFPRDMDGLTSEERTEPHLVPVLVHTSQPQLVQNVSFPVPMSASARVADHFSDPGPATAVKVQQPVSFGATVDGGIDSETVQMNRSSKYHSVESYPGKFPVSDALEYSSLATAYAVRGKGTTSVRPFSDY